jgi:rare lipoprotein A
MLVASFGEDAMTEGFRLRHALGLALALLAAGCTTSEVAQPPTAAAPSTPKAKKQGFYRVGEPYRVGGVLYTPKIDWDYDRTGRASWYGPGFHGQLTANGERFDQNALTAAHQTLPLPSVVRVTNLDNGRSVVLRVNDRGPFVPGRILDVSRRAAQLLKFHDKGTTRVRVEILEDESRQAAAELGWRG